MTHTRLRGITSPYTISKDKNKKGNKSFRGLKRYEDYKKIIDMTPKEDRNFYEVARDKKLRKPYFDLDRATNGNGNISEEEIKEHGPEAITDAIFKLFGVDIPLSDVLIANSSTPEKDSYHLNVISYAIHPDDMKILYSEVAANLSEYADPEDMIYNNPDGSPCLDGCVYGSNQNFRLAGCAKFGKSNYKRIITGHTFEQSLISVCDGLPVLTPVCNTAATTPEASDEEADEDEAAITSQTRWTISPEIIALILDGLSTERSDNFNDYRKTVLALGYHRAGLAEAVKFARRSDNFNHKMTKQLYNKGTTAQAGDRPATVASLLAMLKEDDPRIFRQVMGQISENKEDTAAFLASPDTPPDIIAMITAAGSTDETDEGIKCEDLEQKETNEQKINRFLSNPKKYLANKTDGTLRQLKKLF